MRFAPGRGPSVRLLMAAVAAGLCWSASGSATHALTPAEGDAPAAVSAPLAEPCSPGWLAALKPPSHLPRRAAAGAGPDARAAAAVSPVEDAGPLLTAVPDWRRAARVSKRAVVSARSRALHAALEAADLAQDSAPTRPNDTYQSLQGDSLGRVLHAPNAWQISYGRDDAVIAVISDGVDLGHRDLAAKIWRNRGEIAGNGFDDDRNGFVDDVRGWDFGGDDPFVDGETLPPFETLDGDNLPQPIAFDPQAPAFYHNRGTQMAGIAAAATNNGEGIAGVSWGAQIMPLKATFPYHDRAGKLLNAAFWMKHIIEGVCYATDNGAKVILIGGLPFGDPSREQSQYQSITRLSEAIGHAADRGVPVVVPAGECGVIERPDQRGSCPGGINPDIFPARSNNVNVIAVTSMHVSPAPVGPNIFTRRRTMSTGSWVDIAAPGEGFMTTVNTENNADEPYQMVATGERWPTPDDFAAAHVAGVVAVMGTINPDRTPIQLLGHLCRNAHRDASLGSFELSDDGWLRNDTYGCGVLDFEQTVEHMPFKVRLQASPIVHEFVPLDQGEVLRDIVNPFLNIDAWEIKTETTWLEDAPRPQKVGAVSVRSLRVSVDTLDRWAGGLSSATKIPPQEIRVCPVNYENDTRDLKFTSEDCALGATNGCVCMQLHVHIAEHLHRVYLPWGLRP